MLHGEEGIAESSLYTPDGVSQYYTGNLPDSQGKRSIPPLMRGIIGDLIISKDTYHSFAYNGDLPSFERHITFDYKGVPVYIFDEHHHAFYAWHEAYSIGKIGRGSNLLHVDWHEDGSRPQQLSPGFVVDTKLDLAAVARYTTTELNEASFVWPAMETGLVKHSYWVNPTVTREKAIEQSWKNYHRTSIGMGNPMISTIVKSDTPFILDIDIDYFMMASQAQLMESRVAQDTNLEGLVNADYEIIKELLPYAGVITVALSPGQMDSRIGLPLIKELF